MFKPRTYQVEAIAANVEYFTKKKADYNAFQILPTGSGKSVVIAHTTSALQGKSLILQPSKEILAQNFQKFISQGKRAGIYSASAGMKHIDTVTFATIGSIIKKKHLFRDVANILIDECHLVNAEDGMYQEFIKSVPKARVLGLTATPYRLTSDMDGAMLKFLNRTNPRIFNKVNYYVQNDTLFNAGHLAPLKYFHFDVIDRSQLEMNSSGTDFTDSSLREYQAKINMPAITIKRANQILSKRRSLLVFCSLISEAKKVVDGILGSALVTGDTDPYTRDKILKDFKAGRIRCVVNVGVLTTGFDYPELEAVLISRSTMSLALYYQIVGRVMRPYQYADGTWKEGWVVDLGGNINFFGKIEDLKIERTSTGLYYIRNGQGKQLTNVTFSKS